MTCNVVSSNSHGATYQCKGEQLEQVRNVILIRLEVMLIYHEIGLVWFMVFKTTYNNISVWWSVLLVEETGVPGQNHRHVVSQ